MANDLTTEDVRHVAQLAKLEFPENEIQDFTDTLGKIIDMIETLNEVDTEGVAFTMNVADNESRMREDIAVPGWKRDELLRSVPTTENGFIQVPAMIPGGGDA